MRVSWIPIKDVCIERRPDGTFRQAEYGMKLRFLWTILYNAAAGWIDHNAPRLSAALAFYTILSVAPLLVIVTAIAGAVFGEEAASGQLIDQLRGILGESGAEVVKSVIEKSDKASAGTSASIIGIATLLFGASGVFGELQGALNTVWNVKPKPGRGILGTIHDRFLSFGMVLAVGFLLLVTLIITTALAAFSGYLEGLVPGLSSIMQIANSLLSFFLVTALFAMIFKLLPDVKIIWRDVLFGSLVTALLFTIGKVFIGLYLGKAGVATPFGAAGSLVAFVVWIYYSSLILFFGVELTQATVTHLKHSVEPTSNADFVADTPPISLHPPKTRVLSVSD